MIRIKMIKSGYAQKNEYERNEVELLRLETSLKIAKIKNEIALSSQRFHDFYETYLEVYSENKKNSNEQQVNT